MTIKKTSANVEGDKRLLYKLTKSPSVKKMKDAVGSVINVKAYCHYDDSAEDENEKPVLTLLSADGSVYGTNSKTAIGNFNDLIELFSDEVESEKGLAVYVNSSVSKNGREFILLELGE